MDILFVVDRRQEWPFEIPGTTVVTARAYLTDPASSSGIDVPVVNLCRADRYQGRGYYVSLLAEAHGHRPLPDVKAIEDLQSEAHVKLVSAELDELAQQSLQHDGSDLFQLDSYFGSDPAELHAPLAQQLFSMSKAPLVRSHFKRTEGRWKLDRIAAIGLSDIPPQHRAFLLAAATSFVSGGKGARAHGSGSETPVVAILRDPDEVDRPSNDEALRKFVEAAPAVGLRGRDHRSRRHRTARSIRRPFHSHHHECGPCDVRVLAPGRSPGPAGDRRSRFDPQVHHKVYLNELMNRHKIPTPRTMMVHRDNLEQVVPALGLPCILKQPDGGFGLGVEKIESPGQLVSRAGQLLARSELLIAQEWLPTQFDWRVCVFDRRPLFVCKYFMAPGHWQIIKRDTASRVEGETLTLSVGEAPEIVVSTAVRATNLIGSSLYGVDLKQAGDKCYLIEINDNPNIDAGHEDQVLGDALYREVMGVFARRIAERRRITLE